MGHAVQSWEQRERKPTPLFLLSYSLSLSFHFRQQTGSKLISSKIRLQKFLRQDVISQPANAQAGKRTEQRQAMSISNGEERKFFSSWLGQLFLFMGRSLCSYACFRHSQTVLSPRILDAYS